MFTQVNLLKLKFLVIKLKKSLDFKSFLKVNRSNQDIFKVSNHASLANRNKKFSFDQLSRFLVGTNLEN